MSQPTVLLQRGEKSGNSYKGSPMTLETHRSSISSTSRGTIVRSDQLPQPISTVFVKHDDYSVMSTPGFDEYWYGNFLDLKEPPQPGQLDKWKANWEREFVARSGLGTVVFTWCEALGASADTYRQQADELRLEIDSAVFMSLGLPINPAPVSGLVIRQAADSDWQALHDLGAAQIDENNTDHCAYWKRRLAEFQNSVTAGLGSWWVALQDEQIVGSAGFFGDGQVGRFQEVTTAKEWRSRGIASNLVYEIASAYCKQNISSEVLIAAEPDSQAERIYSRLGFTPFALQFSAMGQRNDSFRR